MKRTLQALFLLLWFTFLTGIAYPITVTLIAHLTMKNKATGSLIINGEQVVGSALIGQKFESDRYFWPRPSAVDYNPLPSGGSNLWPTSQKLKEAVEARRAHLTATAGKNVDPKEIPSDLLFASASGLDPHISSESAYFQIERVAKARKMEKEKLEELIGRIGERSFIFFGPRIVNVLKLNLILDQESKDVH